MTAISKSICFKSADKIADMTRSLETIGINTFAHDITFGRGQLSVLTDHTDIFEFYYKNEFPMVCTNDEGRILKPGIYLNTKLQKDHEDYSIAFPIISKKLKFKNLIHFCEVEQDCQHLYSFSSSLDEIDFLYSITNNLHVLKSFINNYKIQAKTIINQAKSPRYRITLPYLKDDLKNNQLKPLTIKNTSFTSREIDCIQYTIQGKSAKQIASLLNLSTRTVENYIENIKNKMRVHTKYELIAKLVNTPYYHD